MILMPTMAVLDCNNNIHTMDDHAPVIPRVDRSSLCRLFDKKKELPAYFPHIRDNASTCIDHYDDKKKFMSSVVEPIEKKARAGFQKEAVRAKRMSATGSPASNNNLQRQRQQQLAWATIPMGLPPAQQQQQSQSSSTRQGKHGQPQLSCSNG
jgi:hypothetical protein